MERVSRHMNWGMEDLRSSLEKPSDLTLIQSMLLKNLITTYSDLEGVQAAFREAEDRGYAYFPLCDSHGPDGGCKGHK